jgi:hypothetical protein
MSKGVLLFAFNNGVTDYFEMAVKTGKRVNEFLNLPVSVVTDSSTDLSKYENIFDNILIEPAITSNTKGETIWINKGRHKAYELSPYDETLLLDTDYLINSKTLLKPFELYDDFMCHKNTSFLLLNESPQEQVGTRFVDTLWATVIYFKKTNRTKQIFECMSMVQNNYEHYCDLYATLNTTFRNDYALTIALHIVNGGLENPQDYIPWSLVHVNPTVKVYKNSNTTYTLTKKVDKKVEYIVVSDTDFHMLDKENFMELVNE